MDATLTFVINALMSVLTVERVKGFIHSAVNKLQQYVIETDYKYDDALIPASNLVLAALEVPGPDGKIDISAELNKLLNIAGEAKNVFLDAGFDWVEDEAKDSPKKWDDITILPLCKLARDVLNVPDND